MDYNFASTFVVAGLLMLAASGAVSMLFFWLNPYKGSMWTALCVMAGAGGSLAVGPLRVSIPPLEIVIGGSETATLGVLAAAVVVFVFAGMLNYLSREDDR